MKTKRAHGPARWDTGWQRKILALALLLCAAVSAGHVVWVAQANQATLPQGWLYLAWSASSFFPDTANWGSVTPPTYEWIGAAYLLFHLLVLLLAGWTLLSGRTGGSRAKPNQVLLAVLVLLCGALSAALIAWIVQLRGIFEDVFQATTLRQAWFGLVWVAKVVFVGDESRASIPLTDYLGFAALGAFHILGVVLAVRALLDGGEPKRASLSALIGEKGVGVD